MKRIVIVGPGRMGRGMAHAFLHTGFEVALLDVKPRGAAEAETALAAARHEIAHGIGVMREIGRLDIAQEAAMLARLSLAAGAAADAALARADAVFEAVPEVMEQKQAAFARVCAHVGADVAIASTTSTFDIEALARFVTNPARFLNTHWLNPAFLVPLVEVSPGAGTDEAVLAAMEALLREAGKVPVRCKAAPGFIVPRIQALAMNEAARIVTEGVATAEAVDTALRTGFGPRFSVLGLLEFVDYGGGDILYYASNYLKDALAAPRFEPPPVIVDNMREGRIGARTGQGFYDWRGRDMDEYRRQTFAKLADLFDHLGLLARPR
jgi:3-hydroxybutyryl-CoA dehydrogenase